MSLGTGTTFSPITCRSVELAQVCLLGDARLEGRCWWQSTGCMQRIQPRRTKVHTIREKFASLTDIDFSACENVRNRNIAILAASRLKLKSVSIGHVATLAYGKPRITNSVRAHTPSHSQSAG